MVTTVSDLPIALDVLDPEVEVLSLPDVAQRLGLPVTRVHQMLRDGQLMGVRRDGVVLIPAEFLSGDAIVKGLPGTITLLREPASARVAPARFEEPGGVVGALDEGTDVGEVQRLIAQHRA